MEEKGKGGYWKHGHPTGIQDQENNQVVSNLRINMVYYAGALIYLKILGETLDT